MKFHVYYEKQFFHRPSTGNSWADKVKGIKPVVQPVPVAPSHVIVPVTPETTNTPQHSLPEVGTTPTPPNKVTNNKPILTVEEGMYIEQQFGLIL